MSREQNEDEVRDGYIQKMGKDLGELFHAGWPRLPSAATGVAKPEEV